MLGVHLTLVRSALCKSDSTIASRRAFSISSALGSDGLPANGPYDVLFCGSDKFASTILQYLGGYGKGSAWKSLTLLVPTAVAQSRPVEPASTTLAAKDLGISIHEMPPEGIPSTEDSARWELPQRHRSVNPHSLLITASFGQMIPNWMLDRFTAETSSSMALNVHPSMLPHLRGAAPIQWAIARRLADTGVSIQQLSRGTFDQGHILAQMPSDIPQGSTYTSLMPTLARKGAELLLDTIINLPQRHLNAQQQDSAKATLAPKLDPRRAEIDWHQMTAEDIEARFRAFGPSVPQRSWLHGSSSGEKQKSLHILFRGVSLPNENLLRNNTSATKKLQEAEPGVAALASSKGQKVLLVRTASRPRMGEGQSENHHPYVVVTDIQSESRKRLAVRHWWNGQSHRKDAEKRLHFGTARAAGTTASPRFVDSVKGQKCPKDAYSSPLTSGSIELTREAYRRGLSPEASSGPQYSLGFPTRNKSTRGEARQLRLYATTSCTPINTDIMKPSLSRCKPPRHRGILAKAIGDGFSWSQLNPAQKVFRTGYKTGQVGLVIGGALLTGTVLWALLSEMFAPNSPSVIYKDACKRIEQCPEIYEHLLPPLRFHTQPTSSYFSSFSIVNLPSGSRRRSSHLPTSTIVTERSSRGDLEVLVLHFYLEARDKDRDWTYVEKARQSVADAWALTKATVGDWLEQVREERIGVLSSSEIDETHRGCPCSATMTASTTINSEQQLSSLSRFISYLSPLPSSKGSAGLRKRREPGTFSTGEVRAELIYDAQTARWQYRKLFVDVPNRGTLGATRVWIVKREGEAQR